MIKKIQKISLFGFLAFALVFSVGVYSANAAITVAVNAITETGALTITTAVGSAGNLFTTTTTGAINIGTSATTGDITIGGAQTSGAITIGGGVQTGTITFGGGTGAQTVNIGTGDTGAKTINVGTSAVANTITVGNVTGATAVTVNSGTGGFAVNSTSTGDITLTSTDDLTLAVTDDVAITSGSTNGIINIGTSAFANVITVGNVTGATAVTVNSGTGGFAVNTTSTGDITLTTADDFSLIGAAGSLLTLGNSTAGVLYSEETEAATATDTLVGSESGKTLYISGGAQAYTLPAVADGAVFRFVVAGSLTGDATIIVPSGSNLIEGALIVAGAVVDCDAEDTLTFVSDGENLGDFVELRSNGTNWFIGASGALTASKLTCTAS